MPQKTTKSSELITITAALSVLEFIANSGRPTRLTDISYGVNMPKARVHRILNTLCSRGYAYQDSDTQLYSIGIETWLLGLKASPGHHLLQESMPQIRRLREEFQETVFLSIIDKFQALYIYAIHGTHPLRSNVDEGSRGPLYATATGKALLAFQPDEMIPALLDPTNDGFDVYKKCDPVFLMNELSQIRRIGYAISVDEWYFGVSGVGAAILDPSQNSIAAIGISFPTSRLTDSFPEEMGKAAHDAAMEISHKIFPALAKP